MKPFLFLFAFLFAFLSPLSAHPTGHDGGFLDTAIHFLTQPFHLLTWGVVLVAGVWLGWRSLRSRKEHPDR